ncbi:MULTISPECIES: DUF3830 family protein [Nitrospirillum]|uniref:Uncharacterized protein DUF3830 n=1 Tax=Nitrospirillum amazonense TaxID=28077 RepID=A0A560F1Q7_9PROT|nr:DUF3830 family protein [Nitrospirillum amazonense]MEC4594728.1 DUF3830 family protein [Nitrospirillum amazonense]TWB15562.1 uncharacterized protein DUF3830 [Nitrospirillum amazonense]
MTLIDITAGGFRFTARLEEELAPATCARFLAMQPYDEKLIHVRWSGEGCWIPMGDTPYDLPWENATRHPAPGQFIFYPGGYSETEILLAYGGVAFASKLGPLAGNHFLTIIEGQEQLPALGRKVLWEGAQPISFRPRA